MNPHREWIFWAGPTQTSQDVLHPFLGTECDKQELLRQKRKKHEVQNQKKYSPSLRQTVKRNEGRARSNFLGHPVQAVPLGTCYHYHLRDKMIKLQLKVNHALCPLKTPSNLSALEMGSFLLIFRRIFSLQPDYLLKLIAGSVCLSVDRSEKHFELLKQ